MRSAIYRLMMIVIWAIALHTGLAAQPAAWRQLDGPPGGYARIMGAGEGSLFATLDTTGVFRSTDHGSTWSAPTTGLENHTPTVFTMSGYVLYMGTTTGLFRSSNAGALWTPLAPHGSPMNISAVAAHGERVAVVADCRLLFSLNGGRSWKELEIEPGAGCVSAVAVNGSNLIAALERDNVATVYRSTDDGITWSASRVDSQQNVVRVISLAAYGSTLFAGTSWEPGLFRSTDGGATWNRANVGFSRVRSIMMFDSIIIADASAVSSDSGVTWSSIEHPIYYEVNSMARSGNYYVVGTKHAGIYRLQEKESDWTSIRSPYVNTTIESIGSVGATIVAQTGSRYYRSTDNGATWSPGGGSTRFTQADGAIYAAGNNGIVYSTDNGASWRDMSAGLVNRRAAGIIVVDSLLVTGTLDGVYRYNRSDTRWERSGEGITDNLIVDLIAVERTLFVITRARIFRSRDNASTWQDVSDGLSGHTIHAVTAVGTTLLAATSDGLYRSIDYGTTWSRAVNAGLPSTDIRSMTIAGGLIAVGSAAGVHVSGNMGNTWISHNAGLTNTDVTALRFVGGKLLAGTDGSGIFISSPPVLSVETIPAEDNAILHGPIPNPTTGDATVRYRLPQAGRASLTMIDPLGNHIRTIIDAPREAGDHSITINASDLPSGLYFCRLKAGDRIATRQLLITR